MTKKLGRETNAQREFRLKGPLGVRQVRQENQTVFWGRMGITQSGGSRYEQGRPMPGPARKLFGVLYLGERLPSA